MRQPSRPLKLATRGREDHPDRALDRLATELADQDLDLLETAIAVLKAHAWFCEVDLIHPLPTSPTAQPSRVKREVAR